MKRLLAYLFLVLGLVFFNVNAVAKDTNEDYICVYANPKFPSDLIIKFVDKGKFKEPNQTQEVEGKLDRTLRVLENLRTLEFLYGEDHTRIKDPVLKEKYAKKSFNKKCLHIYYRLKNKEIYQKLVSNSSYTGFWEDGAYFNSEFEQWKIIDKAVFNKLHKKQTQIAKKEPKKKEKKKVANVVEQEQKEFKPKKKDIDNDPPRIEIAEAITVVSQSYTIKGLVRDKSKPIYLEINGRPVEVKNGKFELERFNIDPDVVEELKIVAIDPWNNRSEKLVKVTVELQSTEVVRTFDELRPNRVKVKIDKDKIAIIIGIEKYKNMPECNYCNRDAKAFKAYATRALGVVPSNVISLVDSKATRGEILRAFKISLPRIAGDGGKDINIFFAGHGLASESGEELYIIPQDGDQSLLADTAISRVELIKLIKNVDPKSVTMFFDTCYSGQTRGEQMLVASLRGIRIVEAGGIPDNFTIFTASSSNQGSSHIEEVKQGIFSYYLMKGLEGKADEDRNKEITNGELIAYLKTNVSREAFSQAREQDPMLSGDPDQVLMRYR